MFYPIICGYFTLWNQTLSRSIGTSIFSISIGRSYSIAPPPPGCCLKFHRVLFYWPTIPWQCVVMWKLKMESPIIMPYLSWNELSKNQVNITNISICLKCTYCCYALYIISNYFMNNHTNFETTRIIPTCLIQR